MEGRIRSLLLSAITVLATFAAPVIQAVELGDKLELEPVIQPEIQRQDFDEAKINVDDFEVKGFVGFLSVEDFGVNTVSGFKIAYHVSENYFVQAAIGESTAGETSFEVLSAGAPLLSDDERNLEFYQINVGYNLFPGEAFVSQETTLNDAFYVIAGLGNTNFAGDDRYTVNYGFGYRILFLDAFSFNADIRDHLFDMDIFGEKVKTHNIEYSLALGWYF